MYCVTKLHVGVQSPQPSSASVKFSYSTSKNSQRSPKPGKLVFFFLNCEKKRMSARGRDKARRKAGVFNVEALQEMENEVQAAGRKFFESLTFDAHKRKNEDDVRLLYENDYDDDYDDDEEYYRRGGNNHRRTDSDDYEKEDRGAPRTEQKRAWMDSYPVRGEGSSRPRERGRQEGSDRNDNWDSRSGGGGGGRKEGERQSREEEEEQYDDEDNNERERRNNRTHLASSRGERDRYTQQRGSGGSGGGGERGGDGRGGVRSKTYDVENFGGIDPFVAFERSGDRFGGGARERKDSGGRDNPYRRSHYGGYAHRPGTLDDEDDERGRRRGPDWHPLMPEADDSRDKEREHDRYRPFLDDSNLPSNGYTAYSVPRSAKSELTFPSHTDQQTTAEDVDPSRGRSLSVSWRNFGKAKDK